MSVQFNIRIDKEVAEWARDFVAQEGKTLSAWVEEVLANELGTWEEQHGSIECRGKKKVRRK